MERAAAHPATPRVILHRLATTPEVAGVRLAARAGDGGRAGRHTHRLDATDNAHLATIMEAPEAAEGLTVVTVGDAG